MGHEKYRHLHGNWKRSHRLQLQPSLVSTPGNESAHQIFVSEATLYFDYIGLIKWIMFAVPKRFYALFWLIWCVFYIVVFGNIFYNLNNNIAAFRYYFSRIFWFVDNHKLNIFFVIFFSLKLRFRYLSDYQSVIRKLAAILFH